MKKNITVITILISFTLSTYSMEIEDWTGDQSIFEFKEESKAIPNLSPATILEQIKAQMLVTQSNTNAPLIREEEDVSTLKIRVGILEDEIQVCNESAELCKALINKLEIDNQDLQSHMSQRNVEIVRLTVIIDNQRKELNNLQTKYLDLKNAPKNKKNL